MPRELQGKREEEGEEGGGCDFFLFPTLLHLPPLVAVDTVGARGGSGEFSTSKQVVGLGVFSDDAGA